LTTGTAGLQVRFLQRPRWKKYWTIGPRKFLEFAENISPRKKDCSNLDKRRIQRKNSNHDLRNAIISASILIVRWCTVYRMM
jgi:hypothetical protein